VSRRRLHKLHKEELVIKSRRMRWAGHVALMGDRKDTAYWVLVGRSDGKRPLGVP